MTTYDFTSTHVMSVTSKILDAFRSADPMGKENGHYTTVEFSIPQAKSKLYMTLQNQEIVILQKVSKFSQSSMLFLNSP